MDSKKIFVTNLKTYDVNYEFTIDMYDRIPYQRDYDMCNETTLAKRSGNIIKFYEYKLDPPYKVENDDKIYFLKKEPEKKTAFDVIVNDLDFDDQDTAEDTENISTEGLFVDQDEQNDEDIVEVDASIA